MPRKRLMSTAEVAEQLGIQPQSVRSTLRTYGITEERGYPRARVENLQRLGTGHRSDLKPKRRRKADPNPPATAQRSSASCPERVDTRPTTET